VASPSPEPIPLAADAALTARDWQLRHRLVPAVYVLLSRDGRVLLMRRQGTGFQDGKLSTIAGHLEADEGVLACAVREAAEEAGVRLAPADLAVVTTMHRRTGEPGHERVDFFVAATGWGGEPVNREPAKCSELVWAPIDDLPADTIPYVRRAIENWRAGVHFDSWGWDAADEQM
jgi:8-oxo-dGTP pyrophosphatase MutT (NUDIX family)